METKKIGFKVTEIHTFGQLIEAVPEVPMLAEGVKRKSMPTDKNLRESAEVLVQRAIGDHTIVIYSNGFFEIADAEHYTVYPISYLKSLSWIDHDGHRYEVAESIFDDVDWSIPLLVEGGHRLENNASHKNRSAIKGEVAAPISEIMPDDDEEDQKRHEEAVAYYETAMKKFTNKQGRIIQELRAGIDLNADADELMKRHRASHSEVAAKLGTDRRVVDRVANRYRAILVECLRIMGKRPVPKKHRSKKD